MWENGKQEGNGKVKLKGFRSRYGVWKEGRLEEWVEGILDMHESAYQSIRTKRTMLLDGK